MDGRHRIGIALLLAGAAAASTVGIARSVSGGNGKASSTATERAIQERQVALDQAEREIARSLARRPPRLPDAAPSDSSAGTVMVVTRRAASAVVSSGDHGDDDEHGVEREDDD
jgi:hypothetical protein